MKALLQQALDALELAEEKFDPGLMPLTCSKVSNAITSLRAAIAQPERKLLGYVDGKLLREFSNGGNLGWFKVYVDKTERCKLPVYTGSVPAFARAIEKATLESKS